MKDEKLLYGRKIGSEEWEEIILSSQPENFENVKILAARDGFGYFREVVINLSQKPDFTKTINKKRSV